MCLLLTRLLFLIHSFFLKINFIEERIRNLGGSPDISRVKKIQQTNFNCDNKYQEEANRVLSNLAKHIGDYDSKMEHYNKEFEYNLNKGLEDDISLDIKIDDLQVDKSYHVTNFLKEFQKLSLKTKYYFFDCPFQVYEDTYHQRKNKYLQDKIDFDESDFIMDELNKLLDFQKEESAQGNLSYRHHGKGIPNRFFGFGMPSMVFYPQPFRVCLVCPQTERVPEHRDRGKSLSDEPERRIHSVSLSRLP